MQPFVAQTLGAGAAELHRLSAGGSAAVERAIPAVGAGVSTQRDVLPLSSRRPVHPRNLLGRARTDPFPELIGSSIEILWTVRLMMSAAASQITVLIGGETGTGKELVARGIHRLSDRSAGPFVAMNCAAVPESLLESELFGHRRGAFTGALTEHLGFFEAAEGGTIFLDEIGEMPLSMQGRLLRVLQEREVVPVGDTRPRKIDVRVISATNCNLADDLARGRFRRDLYYRLNAFPITLPPLRQRCDDIPLLARHFMQQAAARHGKRISDIAPAALESLLAQYWAGNVRQLENAIERAVALASDGGMIEPGHLPAETPGLVALDSHADAADHGPSCSPVDEQDVSCRAPSCILPLRSFREARALFEAEYFGEMLRRHDGNVTRTAQAVGLSRVMLRKKLKHYGVR